MNEDLKSGDNGAPPQAAADNGTQASDQGARPAATSRPLPDDALIILPVRNAVMFPALVIPLAIGRERARAAAQEAVRLERPIGVLLQSRPDIEEPGPDDLHWVGTSAGVLRYITTPDGVHHAVVKGMQRFRVLQFLDGYPYTVASVQLIPDDRTSDTDIEARMLSLKERAGQVLQLLPQVPEEVAASLQAVEEPARLADLIAGLMDISVEQKQALLETIDLRTRLDRVLDLLSHRLEVLKVSREIDERTRETIGDANRKHVLREQMRAIQKELGYGDQSAA
jgi:ATP-dependent Lon protease